MDNQQGRLVPFADEAFIGGLITGEGSFFVTKVQRRRANSGPEYRPGFAIGMCDLETMEAVADAFRRWNLPFYWYDYSNKQGRRRQFYTIQTSGMLRMRRVLEKLRPHLMGDKKAAADALWIFIEERMAHVAEAGNAKHAPWTERELDLLQRVKAINRGENPQRLHAVPLVPS
jgi:hypothetical protein